MTCVQFIGNLEGLNDGQDFPKDLLKVGKCKHTLSHIQRDEYTSLFTLLRGQLDVFPFSVYEFLTVMQTVISQLRVVNISILQ